MFKRKGAVDHLFNPSIHLVLGTTGLGIWWEWLGRRAHNGWEFILGKGIAETAEVKLAGRATYRMMRKCTRFSLVNRVSHKILQNDPQ